MTQVIVASILALVGLHQSSDDCAESRTQTEMNACAHRAFVTADDNLNAQWRQTEAVMRRHDRSWTGSDDGRPGYHATLLAAQRAWIALRDAQCALEGYAARGGSLEPLLVSTCKRRMTEQRTAELGQILKEIE